MSVPIDNPTDDYPHGDNVQALERWEPPDVWESLSNNLLNDILDVLDAGMPDGERYSAAPSARKRPAWRVVQEHAPDKTEVQCRHVIATWMRTGVLKVEKYQSPERREKVDGLVVDASEAADEECPMSDFSSGAHRAELVCPIIKRASPRGVSPGTPDEPGCHRALIGQPRSCDLPWGPGPEPYDRAAQARADDNRHVELRPYQQRLGPITAACVRTTNQRDEVKGEQATHKVCPRCDRYLERDASRCEHCGHECPVPVRKIEVHLDECSPLIADPLPVEAVVYTPHRKPGRPASLRIAYKLPGERWLSEWLPLFHGGLAGRLAAKEWRARGGGRVPDTIEAAVLAARVRLLRPPAVRVVTQGGFDKPVPMWSSTTASPGAASVKESVNAQ